MRTATRDTAREGDTSPGPAHRSNPTPASPSAPRWRKAVATILRAPAPAESPGSQRTRFKTNMQNTTVYTAMKRRSQWTEVRGPIGTSCQEVDHHHRVDHPGGRGGRERG